MPENSVVLYNSHNEPITKAAIPNLDPYFFSPNNIRGVEDADIIARQAYARHVWIYSCASVIAQEIVNYERVLYRIGKEEDLIREHEILELFDAPNPFMNRESFITAIVLHLLISDGSNTDNGGQCFIICDSGEKDPHVDIAKGKMPIAMFPYSSRNVKPMKKYINGVNKLIGWQWIDHNNSSVPTIEYDLNQVIRIYKYNPYDWLKGISPYTAALCAIGQDIRADIFNTKFFDNDATPGGILKSEQQLNEQMARENAARWNATHQGAGNVGRIAVLGSGLDFKTTAPSHTDMAYIEQKKMNMEQIVSAFHLNKIALGQYESLNLATIREGRRMLHYDTYMPLANMIISAFNTQWIKFVEKGLRLKNDYSNCEALKEDYGEKIKIAVEMVRTDIPWKLAARINNIPLTKQDITDYPWLNEKPVKVAPAPIALSLNDKKPYQQEKGIIKISRMTEREKRSESYIERVLVPGENKFNQQMTRFFIAQRNKMQDKVDAWAIKHGAKSVLDSLIRKQIDANPDEFSLELNVENAALKRVISPLIEDQLKRMQKELELELGGLIDWNVTPAKIDLFIAKRKKEMEQINTTTFRRARDTVQALNEIANTENWTVQQYATALKQNIFDVMAIRIDTSKTIARTEIGIVSNDARFDAYQTEGIEYWEWLTAHDEKVRLAHMAADGAIVRVGMPFPDVGLKYPLDTTAGGNSSPENIINCFPADTLICSENVNGAFRGRYSGELVSIKTSSGNELSGTPNHPILTEFGFVPLCKIKKGMKVFGAINSEWKSLANLNIKNMPSHIHEIYHSFSVLNIGMRMSRSDVNLYGDILDGDVDVVWANSKLLNKFNSQIFNQTAKSIFTKTNKGQGFLPTFGFLFGNINEETSRLVSKSNMRVSGKVRSFDIAKLAHSDNIGFTSRSNSDFIFDKPPSDGASIDRVFYGNGKFGHAGNVVADNAGSVKIKAHSAGVRSYFSHRDIGSNEPLVNRRNTASALIRDALQSFPVGITLDPVVDVHTTPHYNGEVYTLNTNNGIYISNGIIASNCRCVTVFSEGQ
jgi:phage portal protein BeeE